MTETWTYDSTWSPTTSYAGIDCELKLILQTDRRTDEIWAVCEQFCFIAVLNELTYTYKYHNP